MAIIGAPHRRSTSWVAPRCHLRQMTRRHPARGRFLGCLQCGRNAGGDLSINQPIGQLRRSISISLKIQRKPLFWSGKHYCIHQTQDLVHRPLALQAVYEWYTATSDGFGHVTCCMLLKLSPSDDGPQSPLLHGHLSQRRVAAMQQANARCTNSWGYSRAPKESRSENQLGPKLPTMGWKDRGGYTSMFPRSST